VCLPIPPPGQQRSAASRTSGPASAADNRESKPISVPVYNRDGAEVGKIEVDPAEFGGAVNRQLLHDVVVMYLANQRAGTHSTLRRGEVAGSTKKLFRQKGTGNARAGTRRTNKRRGGGTAKGPKPRDYEYHLPRKAVRAATRMAVLSKLQDNETIVVDDFAATEVKTKPVATVFKAIKKTLNLKETTILLGTAGFDRNLYLSARNIEGVAIMPVREFNAYTVLRQKRLVLTKAALEELRKGPPTAPATTPTPAAPATPAP
jgi:large subunit ribosomal protein L4